MATPPCEVDEGGGGDCTRTLDVRGECDAADDGGVATASHDDQRRHTWRWQRPSHRRGAGFQPITHRAVGSIVAPSPPSATPTHGGGGGGDPTSLMRLLLVEFLAVWRSVGDAHPRDSLTSFQRDCRSASASEAAATDDYRLAAEWRPEAYERLWRHMAAWYGHSLTWLHTTGSLVGLGYADCERLAAHLDRGLRYGGGAGLPLGPADWTVTDLAQLASACVLAECAVHSDPHCLTRARLLVLSTDAAPPPATGQLAADNPRVCALQQWLLLGVTPLTTTTTPSSAELGGGCAVRVPPTPRSPSESCAYQRRRWPSTRAAHRPQLSVEWTLRLWRLCRWAQGTGPTGPTDDLDGSAPPAYCRPPWPPPPPPPQSDRSPTGGGVGGSATTPDAIGRRRRWSVASPTPQCDGWPLDAQTTTVYAELCNCLWVFTLQGGDSLREPWLRALLVLTLQPAARLHIDPDRLSAVWLALRPDERRMTVAREFLQRVQTDVALRRR